ncbi:MAG: MarR family transcriptional regulator [Burkholderiales bacterium]|nr:MarR family transcriptional regulator [Burkholderiales bacterium]
MSDPFLKTLRQLATCYQAFHAYSSAHVRTLDLTPPQFDVIATLGNTEGMSCSCLGRRTLITKGTLTGVLDRLENRGLLQRTPSEEDRRSVFVRLTAAGDALFQRVFPEHVAYLGKAFGALNADEHRTLENLLSKLSARLAPDTDDVDTPITTPKSRMIAAARRHD